GPLVTQGRPGSRTAARSQAHPAVRLKRWWTGEDSNLRSPQGAADLQSAGFSHSPTRPRKSVRHQTAFATTSYRQTIQEREGRSSENTKRTRVKRHQPVDFALKDSLRS